MTEQKNSSKTTALAQALLLEQVEFFKKTIIYRKLTYLFPAVHSTLYATC